MIMDFLFLLLGSYHACELQHVDAGMVGLNGVFVLLSTIVRYVPWNTSTGMILFRVILRRYCLCLLIDLTLALREMGRVLRGFMSLDGSP